MPYKGARSCRLQTLRGKEVAAHTPLFTTHFNRNYTATHDTCEMNLYESERYHSTGASGGGSPMDWAPLGSKSDRDHLQKDNLDCCCPKTFKTVKIKEEKRYRRESNPGPLA